jgi:hypothetical protein
MGGKICFSLFTFYFLLVFCIDLPASEDFIPEEEIPSALEILETLSELEENPLDLNSATHEELAQIPYLSPLLCQRIIHFRKIRSFQHTSDLLDIAGFNEPLLARIESFITVRQKSPLLSRGVISIRSIWSEKTPKETGYAGNPLGISNKFSYRNAAFFAGATTFKDPYENQYADFYSLYAGVKTEKVTVLVGDYAMDLGERLISGYPGFVFKSSGIIKAQESTVRPYVSGFEDFACRGCAMETKLRMFHGALFVSRNYLDGTIENDSAKRAIYENDYHRTQTELDKKNTIEERLAGFQVAIGNERLKIATSSLLARYNRHIEPEQAHYYRFSGDRYSLSALHFRFAREHLSLWSEYARSHFTQGNGFILGVSAKPRRISIAMLYRDYGETFYSPRAFAFCETEVRNERGIYSFVSVKAKKNLCLTGYLDIFTRPFPTYFNTLSTQGNELSLSLEAKRGRVVLLLRYKRKEKNSFQYQTENLVSIRHNVRCTLKFPLERENTVTFVLEGAYFNVPAIQSNEFAYLASCNLRSQFLKHASGETGFVLFATDSYNSRIYHFINDIPGALYARFFYGHGFDTYLLLKTHLAAHLHLYGKFELQRTEITERIYRFGMEWR